MHPQNKLPGSDPFYFHFIFIFYFKRGSCPPILFLYAGRGSLNSCIYLQRCWCLVWSYLTSCTLCTHPLIFKFCLVNSGWRRDVELNRTDTSSYCIIIYYKQIFLKNVLYKFPRFYNAYGTGGATMIFVHSKTLRVYPRGRHSRTFQLEGMFLRRLPWNLDLPNSRKLPTRMGSNIYISQIQRGGMGRGAKFGTGWRGNW